MTFFGLIGDLARVNFTNKNVETDPLAIATIVTIWPEMPDFSDSYSCIHHKLLFLPGEDISSIRGW